MRQDRVWLLCLIAVVLLVALSTDTVCAAPVRCTVSTTQIDFGNYDVFSAAPTTGTGTITLSCDPKADVTIAIGHSSNSGGFRPRMMDHALLADTLDYNIYTGSDLMTVWGDGTHGTKTVNLTNVKNNNTPPIIINGKIEPLQNVSAGDYGEHLFVTITF
jgi:spore coat protein U-like protein